MVCSVIVLLKNSLLCVQNLGIIGQWRLVWNTFSFIYEIIDGMELVYPPGSHPPSQDRPLGHPEKADHTRLWHGDILAQRMRQDLL